MINLEPGEKIVLEIRRHWLVFVMKNVFLVIFALLPLIFGNLFVTLLFSWPGLERVVIPDAVPYLLYLLWIMALWVSFGVSWTNYYFDAWYVTTERVIDVDQVALFIRREAITSLDKIQDLSISSTGVLASLFHFGTIRVQTAGERREFVMAFIPNPEQVKEQILALVHDFSDRPKKVEVV